MPSFCFSKHPLKLHRAEFVVNIVQMQKLKQRVICLFVPDHIMIRYLGLDFSLLAGWEIGLPEAAVDMGKQTTLVY